NANRRTPDVDDFRVQPMLFVKARVVSHSPDRVQSVCGAIGNTNLFLSLSRRQLDCDQEHPNHQNQTISLPITPPFHWTTKLNVSAGYVNDLNHRFRNEVQPAVAPRVLLP